MGKPVRIVDLARDMIRLSGMSEDEIADHVHGTAARREAVRRAGGRGRGVVAHARTRSCASCARRSPSRTSLDSLLPWLRATRTLSDAETRAALARWVPRVPARAERSPAAQRAAPQPHADDSAPGLLQRTQLRRQSGRDLSRASRHGARGRRLVRRAARLRDSDFHRARRRARRPALVVCLADRRCRSSFARDARDAAVRRGPSLIALLALRALLLASRSTAPRRRGKPRGRRRSKYLDLAADPGARLGGGGRRGPHARAVRFPRGDRAQPRSCRTAPRSACGTDCPGLHTLPALPGGLQAVGHAQPRSSSFGAFVFLLLAREARTPRRARGARRARRALCAHNVLFIVIGRTGYVVLARAARRISSCNAVRGRRGASARDRSRCARLFAVGLPRLRASSRRACRTSPSDLAQWQAGRRRRRRRSASASATTATTLEIVARASADRRRAPAASRRPTPTRCAAPRARATANPHNDYLMIAAQAGRAGARAADRALRRCCGATRARLASRSSAISLRGLVLTMAIGGLFNSLLHRPRRRAALRMGASRCSTRRTRGPRSPVNAPATARHGTRRRRSPPSSSRRTTRRSIARCIESLAWADEIVVVDSGSTDRTLEICRDARRAGAHDADWPGPAPQKNRALERATRRLGALARLRRVGDAARCAREIERTIARRRRRTPRYAHPAALELLRALHAPLAAGGPITCSRLFRRDAARFSDDHMHERLVVERPGRAAARTPHARGDHRSRPDARQDERVFDVRRRAAHARGRAAAPALVTRGRCTARGRSSAPTCCARAFSTAAKASCSRCRTPKAPTTGT